MEVVQGKIVGVEFYNNIEYYYNYILGSIWGAVGKCLMSQSHKVTVSQKTV